MMLLPLYWRRIILPSWVVVWKHESLQLNINDKWSEEDPRPPMYEKWTKLPTGR
jgi:hypothetical protein